jgi:hypothetical protein
MATGNSRLTAALTFRSQGKWDKKNSPGGEVDIAPYAIGMITFE